MKIVVCIKQVPDTTEIKLDPVTGTLIRDGVPSIMNPDDKGGLEFALQLKDQYGAKIVGKTTYGKGVIQTLYTLSDGSGLKITTDEYYTPKHNKIHKVGIKPDIEVDLTKDAEGYYETSEDKDAQLQRAIQELK